MAINSTPRTSVPKRPLPESLRAEAPTEPFSSDVFLDPKITGERWMYDVNKMPKYSSTLYHPLQGDEQVNPKDAAADLRDLAHLIKHTYARSDDYIKAGFDVEKFTAGEADRVARLKTVTIGEAFEPTYRALKTAVRDEHLSLNVMSAWEHVDNNPEMRAQEFRGPADALRQALAVSGAVKETADVVPTLDNKGQLGRAASLSVVGTRAIDTLHKLGFKSVEEALPSEWLEGTGGPAYSFSKKGDVGVIRLTTFNADNHGAELSAFVNDVARHRECSTLIMDLRGNGGGNDGYMADWIAQMRTPMVALKPYEIYTHPSGEQAEITTWDTLAHIKRFFDADQQAGIDEAMAEARTRWPLHDGIPAPTLEEEIGHGKAASNWNGKIVALVDRRNGSSGESAVMMLTNWMGATVVGERTAGYIESGNVWAYPLPRTGVTWMVPTFHAVPKDKRMGESVGIPIDIALTDAGEPNDQIIKDLPVILAAKTTGSAQANVA